MLLTVERCISVVFPMKAKIICTRVRTLGALSLVFLFLFGMNAMLLYFITLNSRGECNFVGPDDESGALWYQAFFSIDQILYIGIPFLIIVLCNIVILVKVIQSQFNRSHFKSSHGEPDKGVRLTSTTYMLITVSIMFLVLTLPISIYIPFYIGMVPTEPWYTQRRARMDLIYNIVTLISYVNNSINFLFYLCLIVMIAIK